VFSFTANYVDNKAQKAPTN